MNQPEMEGKEVFLHHKQDKTVDDETSKAAAVNEISAMFLSQQQKNMDVKDAMFRELAQMALPEHMIKNILHLENEPPF